jgi:O-antigen ligase
MKELLKLLQPLQLFFIPALIGFLLWSCSRTVLSRDRAVGLVLYLALVIIVDSYMNTGIPIPGMAQGSIRYSEVCALFLLFSNPSTQPLKKNDKFLLFLVFLYFILIFYAGLRGETFWHGIADFRRLIVPQILAFMIAYKGFKEEDYGRFLFHLTPLLLAIGLFTLWDVFFDISLLKSDMLYKPEYWNNRRAGRFGSFFLNPNFMGAFTVLFFLPVFLRTFQERTLVRRLYCLSGLLALAFAFIETQSRGPVFGILIALATFFVLPTMRYPLSRKLGFLIIFLFIFYMLMPGFFEHVLERFGNVSPEDAERPLSRQTLWTYTANIIKDYPIFGIGMGETHYIQYMVNYGFAEEYPGGVLDNPHNSYLQVAVYAGIPALLSFVFANLLLIRKVFSVILRNREEELSVYLTGFLAGIAGFMVCLSVDMQLFTQNVAPVFWVLFGLCYSALRFERI